VENARRRGSESGSDVLVPGADHQGPELAEELA
jgi:hypothetical protein